MLTLLSIDTNVPLCTVQVDDYIPLSIEWDERNFLIPRVYFRTGNLDTEMLEIGIESDSGKLSSITLVSIEKITFIPQTLQQNQPCQKGFPVFSLPQSWKEQRYIDAPEPLTLTVWQDVVELSFPKEKVSTHYVQSNNVRFGIGIENQLVSICLPLDLEQLKKLKEYAAYLDQKDKHPPSFS